MQKNRSSKQRTGRGRNFRQTVSSSLRMGVGDIATLTRKAGLSLSKQTAGYTLDKLNVGERTLYRHRDGHVLAAERLLKPIYHHQGQFRLFQCEDVALDQVVTYRLNEVNALATTNLQLRAALSHVKMEGEKEKVQEKRNTSRKSTLPNIDRLDALSIGRRSTAFSEAGSVMSKTRSYPYRRGKSRLRGTGQVLITNNSIQIFDSPRNMKKKHKKSKKMSTLTMKSMYSSYSRKSKKSTLRISVDRQMNVEPTSFFEADIEEGAALPLPISYSEALEDEETLQSQLHVIKEYHWSHIYDVRREPGSADFEIIFYAYGEEDAERFESLESGHCATDVFHFAVLTMKAENGATASEMITAIYKAVEGQAKMAAQTAQSLLGPIIKGNKVDVAEDYMRLTIDLWTFARGIGSPEVAEAQQALVEHLKTQEDADNEAGFWEERMKENEEKEKEMDNIGAIVEGISI